MGSLAPGGAFHVDPMGKLAVNISRLSVHLSVSPTFNLRTKLTKFNRLIEIFPIYEILNTILQ